jgi:hypothetical protein
MTLTIRAEQLDRIRPTVRAAAAAVLPHTGAIGAETAASAAALSAPAASVSALSIPGTPTLPAAPSPSAAPTSRMLSLRPEQHDLLLRNVRPKRDPTADIAGAIPPDAAKPAADAAAAESSALAAATTGLSKSAEAPAAVIKRPGLRLRSEQVGALAEESLIERLTGMVRQTMPAAAAKQSPKELEATVRAARADAAGMGVTTSRGLARFVGLSVLLGPAIFQQQAVAALFTSSGMDPDTALDALYSAVEAKLVEGGA